MANRVFNRTSAYLANRVVTLAGPIAYVHSGTAATSNIRGVTSVTYSATGVFTIQLDDVYQKLLHPSMSSLYASGSKDFTWLWISEAVATTGVIVANLMTGASAAAPGVNATFYLKLVLQNSEVG